MRSALIHRYDTSVVSHKSVVSAEEKEKPTMLARRPKSPGTLYDFNPQNAWGHVVKVVTGDASCNVDPSGVSGLQVQQ